MCWQAGELLGSPHLALTASDFMVRGLSPWAAQRDCVCRQAWENGLSAYLALTATEFEISGVLSEPSKAAALNGNGSWQARPCLVLCTGRAQVQAYLLMMCMPCY